MPKEYFEIMAGIEMMLLEGLSRKDPCFCRSGKKYKHYHGKKLEQNLRKMKAFKIASC